jgi:predicted small integral membrane protein
MAPKHGARAGKEDPRALSFLVQAAGTSEVNGIYIRSGSQNQGVDVYVKKGTSYAIFKRKENHWSLADLGGGSPNRWNLRCIELYRCDRVPGGFVPPDFGWKQSEGEHPGPFIVAAKNPSLRLSLPRMELSQSPSQMTMAPPPRTLSGSQSDGALGPVVKVFGSDRIGELMKKRDKPTASAVPLFASSHAALTAGLSRQGTAGHVNYLLCYTVVLSRPHSKVAWGCRWRLESYEDIGARDIESIDDGSPLARWNTWQSIRSRPDFCVLPGDRLLRINGRWAYFDQEIGNDEHDIDDPNQSLHRKLNSPAIPIQTSFDGSKAGKDTNNIVLEFARSEVLRPMPPGPPKVTQPDSEAMLEISWSPLSWHPNHIAYAVAIQDVMMRVWYTVDAAGTARPRADGIDVGAIRGDVNFVTILKGLSQGRTYVACVAVCTEYGWSAFSAASRQVTMSTQFAISDVLLEDFEHPVHAIDPDAWPDRPHYMFPLV